MEASHQIEHWPLDRLKVNPRNAVIHSEAKIAALVAGIREFGWTNAILADAEGIVAGHRRRAAAELIYASGERLRYPNGDLVPEGTAPVVNCAGWSAAKRRAYVLFDNKSNAEPAWDFGLLSEELQELDAGDFDMSLTGFSAAEIEQIQTWTPDGDLEGLTDPDDAPEAPDTPVSRPGDVWIMGKHRLTCGDSTVAADVARVLAGVEPHLMVTDPPYGVEYVAGWRGKALKDGAVRAEGQVSNDGQADWREAWALFPGDVAYVWHESLCGPVVQSSLGVCGLQPRSQIIWAKPRFAISRGHYHWQHESCLYAVKKGGTGHWSGDRSQTTLWTISHNKSETGHSTQKPVECMRRPIENNSSPGQAVYEPFSGSGTTIIAAEQTNRCCYAIELSPNYVDVAVLRWQSFTGKQARLEATSQSFEEVSAARNPVKEAVAA